MERSAGLSPRGVWFWVLARPVFRAVDFHASYASARRFRAGRPTDAATLTAFDARRRELQGQLAALSASHGGSCAECKGGCCMEERFRDSFLDRIMTDQSPRNTASRSLRSAHREEHVHYPPLRSGPPTTPGYCPQCTPQGCTLAPEDRPIQCLAYQCRATVSTLSDEEVESGIRAVKSLMGVMIETAHARCR